MNLDNLDLSPVMSLFAVNPQVANKVADIALAETKRILLAVAPTRSSFETALLMDQARQGDESAVFKAAPGFGPALFAVNAAWFAHKAIADNDPVAYSNFAYNLAYAHSRALGLALRSFKLPHTMQADACNGCFRGLLDRLVGSLELANAQDLNNEALTAFFNGNRRPEGTVLN